MSGSSLFLCHILPYKTHSIKDMSVLKPLFPTSTCLEELFCLCARDRILQKRQANTPCPAGSSISKIYIVQTSLCTHGRFTPYQYVEMSHQAPHVDCFCSKLPHEFPMFWLRLFLLPLP
jgi:hypothetical protein